MQDNDYIFLIGTKAEWLKVRHIIRHMRELNCKITILNTSQHENLYETCVSPFLDEHNLEVDFHESTNLVLANVNLWRWSYQIAKWLKVQISFIKSQHLQTCIVVHGDTATAMLGTFVGNLLGSRIIHVEAGLRSHNIMHPFPEEIIRRIVDRKSFINFAPNSESANRIKNVKGLVINSRGNTFLDSLDPVRIMRFKEFVHNSPNKHVVVALHRQEFIRRKFFVRSTYLRILEVARDFNIKIILDNQALTSIETKLLNTLQSHSNVEILQPQDHADFIALLFTSEFVIADSGGIQEEAGVLGFPLLVHRKVSERQDGVGKNVHLSNWNIQAIDDFVLAYQNFRKPILNLDFSPSRYIAKQIVQNSRHEE
jgi:UDP-N-acetylglucosamine 2-epimerase (non-hydrolysing)